MLAGRPCAARAAAPRPRRPGVRDSRWSLVARRRRAAGAHGLAGVRTRDVQRRADARRARAPSVRRTAAHRVRDRARARPPSRCASTPSTLRSGLLFDVRHRRTCCGSRSRARAADREPDEDDDRARRRRPLQAERPGADHAGGVALHGSGVGLLPRGKRVPSSRCSTGCCCRRATTPRSRWPSTSPDPGALHREDERRRRARWGCDARTSRPSRGSSTRATTRARPTSRSSPTRCSPTAAARIVGSRSAVLPFPIKGGKLFLYNNNPLLHHALPGRRRASRPGFTTPSGPCLVATARRGRAWLGVVLLHSANTDRPGRAAAQRRLRKVAKPRPARRPRPRPGEGKV